MPPGRIKEEQSSPATESLTFEVSLSSSSSSDVEPSSPVVSHSGFTPFSNNPFEALASVPTADAPPLSPSIGLTQPSSHSHSHPEPQPLPQTQSQPHAQAQAPSPSRSRSHSRSHPQPSSLLSWPWPLPWPRSWSWFWSFSPRQSQSQRQRQVQGQSQPTRPLSLHDYILIPAFYILHFLLSFTLIRLLLILYLLPLYLLRLLYSVVSRPPQGSLFAFLFASIQCIFSAQKRQEFISLADAQRVRDENLARQQGDGTFVFSPEQVLCARREAVLKDAGWDYNNSSNGNSSNSSNSNNLRVVEGFVVCGARVGVVHELPVPPGRKRGTVLLLHGNPSWCFMWRDVIPALVAQGYEVYALDFLGHGLSDKPVDPRLISFQLHVRTLREFFTRFDVPRDCILVGHDWGGCIALSAAPTLPLIRPRIFCLNTFFAPRPSDIRLHYYLLYILWFLSTGIFDGFLPEWAIMRYMAPSPTTTADVVRGYGAPFSPTSSFSSFTYSQAALSSGNAGESEFEIRTGPGPGPGPGESESERDRRGFGFFHHHHYRIFRLPAPVAAWINYMQTYFSALRTHARLLSMSKSSVGRFAHMVPGFSDIFLFNARSTRAFRLLEGLLGPQRVFFSNLAAQALLARDDRLVRAFWRRVGQGSTDGGGVRRAFGTGDDDEENVRVRDNGVHATGSSRDAALNTRSTRRRTTGESSGAASWKATVVFGADDPLLRDFKSVLEDTIEKSALVSVSGDGWIAGAGHYPVEEKPEVVANLICEFAERSRR